MILQLVLSWFVIIIMYIVCVRCRIQVGNGQLGNYQRGHVYILTGSLDFKMGIAHKQFLFISFYFRVPQVYNMIQCDQLT